jgi:ElaB/YqjD/DUF883 family membrane-anchored ribosome-binding protein
MADPLVNQHGVRNEYEPTTLSGLADPEAKGEPQPALPVASAIDNEGFSSETGKTSQELHEAARQQLQVVAGQARREADVLKIRAANVVGKASERISNIKETASERVAQLRREFNARLPVWRAQARHNLQRADAVSKQHPLETIAAAAAFGFIVGVTLRIRRSSRG